MSEFKDWIMDEQEKEEKTYSVDFGSVTVGQDEYNKLTTDDDYARQWIADNAYIDQIVKEG